MRHQLELKDFISSTIIAICEGIAEAKEQTNSKYENCIIAPGHINGKPVGRNPIDRYAIDFEVCVTVEDNNSKTGGMAAKLSVLNFDKNITAESNTVHVNRIKFSVPYLPQGFIVKKT